MASKRKRVSRKKQFFSELDALINDTKAGALDPKLSTMSSVMGEVEEIVPTSVDSSIRSCTTSYSASRDSIANANTELPQVLNEHVILSAQLNAFVPNAFPKKDEYVAMVVGEAVKLSSSVHAYGDSDSSSCQQSTVNLEHLLGPPPLEDLWKVAISTGIPVTCFLAPLVSSCIQCHKSLHVHNTPVRVICYTSDGPLPALKITLRCNICFLNYRYEKYGSTKFGGYRYYSAPRPFVAASQVCYVDRKMCELWVASSHHAWVSFEASAEIYNEVCRETRNVWHDNLKKYLDKYPLSHGDQDGADNEGDILVHWAGLHEISCKTVASAFWTEQLETELREHGREDYLFVNKGSREECMDKIDADQAKSAYYISCK